jgi:hypothetical protein
MPPAPNEEWFRLLASWSEELLATTDRIHYLIGNRHQPTKGSYRESLLRRLLRRVLPDRFRVSTGFIYRWNEQPTRQIDVLIWDAQQHSALLEEGELAILTADAVSAVIEVKSILNATELADALDLLSPPWWVYWRHTPETSCRGLPQQCPIVPFRAVFAYSDGCAEVDATVHSVFSGLASFYRQRFGDDAERAIAQRGNSLEWTNMVDAICIADGPQIEQTCVRVDYDKGTHKEAPGFAAYSGHPTGQQISVGRFCMYLLDRLTGWGQAEAARVTLRSPATLATSGICSFGRFSGTPSRLRLWGQDVSLDRLWYPDPPLWNVTMD